MVSKPEVIERLEKFVCVRLDWDQFERHRSRFKGLTQGNQVVLDPEGRAIPDIDPRGARYKLPELTALLDRVIEKHPPRAEAASDLKLPWFLWNPRDQSLPGRFGAAAVSRLDRKPVLALSGKPPAWLEEADFLRRHLRQFIWTRAATDGPPRLTVRMLEPEDRELAAIDLESTGPEEAGRLLDRAWLEYMKVRPLVARGYIDNPHGNWLKKVMESAHEEELRVREEALKETLLPPGREPPAPPPAE